MKILIAVDGSTCSDAAVDEIAGRPWPAGSEIRVICAVELPLAPAVEPWALSPDYSLETMKILQESAERTVESAKTKLGAGTTKSLKLSSDIIEGSPKRVILDEAKRWSANLIVVGSHGYGVLDRLLLGSVSQAVALHASCSVEIVRSPQIIESKRS